MEDVAQIGTPDYYQRAIRECNAYRRQLMREFGQPPDGSKLMVKSNPHDFGDYYTVQLAIYEDQDQGLLWGMSIENHLPAYWDAESRKELEMNDKDKDKDKPMTYTVIDGREKHVYEGICMVRSLSVRPIDATALAMVQVEDSIQLWWIGDRALPSLERYYREEGYEVKMFIIPIDALKRIT